MTTIKSFTSLEQSKKLAEFLPLESADMYYCYGMDIHTQKCDYDTVPTIIDADNQIDICDIPCWSLASLLSVLPKRIELEGVAYELSIYLNGLYYWNVNNGNLLLEVKGKDNLVDACVDMIEKLHELNLL
jgi:hypothetical protein